MDGNGVGTCKVCGHMIWAHSGSGFGCDVSECRCNRVASWAPDWAKARAFATLTESEIDESLFASAPVQA